MSSVRPNHYICKCDKCGKIYEQQYKGDITNVGLVYYCDLKKVADAIYFLCPDCMQEFKDLVNSFVFKKGGGLK